MTVDTHVDFFTVGCTLVHLDVLRRSKDRAGVRVRARFFFFFFFGRSTSTPKPTMDPSRIVDALRGTMDPQLRQAAETELNQVSVGASAPIGRTEGACFPPILASSGLVSLSLSSSRYTCSGFMNIFYNVLTFHELYLHRPYS